MVNGIAEGYKWAAFLAPVSGAAAGIKTIRAVSKVTELPAMKNITQKEASAVFKNFAKILEKTPNLTADASDDAITAAFLATSSSLPKEITEELFSSIVKNQDTIISIVRGYNPFSVSGEVFSALRKRYCIKAGLTEEAAEQFVRKLQNGTYKRLSDITEENMQTYVSKNMGEFTEVFGEKLSKEFVDDCLGGAFGIDTYTKIKKAITKKSEYARLIREIGIEELDKPNGMRLLRLRFGDTNVGELYTVSKLYKQMQLGNTSISEDHIVATINDIINGSLKSLDSIGDANIRSNLNATRIILADNIYSLGVAEKNKELLQNLAIKGLEKIKSTDGAGILDTQIRAIVQEGLSKPEIINQYGDDVYKMLREHYRISIESLALSPTANKKLIEDITVDAILDKGIDQSAIEQIMRGEATQFWNLTDEQIMSVSNIVADYYKNTDTIIYSNFVDDIAEKRGKVIKEFVENNDILIRNKNYKGGVMLPAGNTADLIKIKYGDIYMSSEGFPIFDKYAIARLESDSLTGIETMDISWANNMYYGGRANIPGYTWHHVEDGRTMILIPTDLHEAYRHTGGALLIREGLNGG